MNTLILGSGFGLYGYLLQCTNIKKYIFKFKISKKIKKRIELKVFKKIIWYNEKN